MDGGSGTAFDARRVGVRVLDASLPLSQALCDVVLSGASADGPIDLSRTMVLVPGGRLSASLTRRLIAQAKAAGRPLFAPTIVTPKRFGPNLVEPTRALLGPLGAVLSWHEVLCRSIAAGDGFAAQVAALFGVAEAPDARLCLRIARRVQRLSAEAAGAMMSLAELAGHAAVCARSDVAAKVAVLAEFAVRRTAVLQEGGVADRDESIRDAVREGRVLTDGVSRVVVLLADPEPIQRRLLELLAASGVRVEVCVHRDDGVDGAGFPIPARWESHAFPQGVIPSASIRVGGRPNESAEVAVETIRAVSAGRAPRSTGQAPLSSDELFVMAPEDETSRALERALALAGAPTATVEARPFGATRLGTLLERLADLVGEGSAESLAAFVRQDDVARWLSRVDGLGDVEDAGDCVTDYRAETLVGDWRDEPVRVYRDDRGETSGFAADYAKVRGAVLRLVAPLEGTKHASAWALPLRAVLAEISGASATQRAECWERDGARDQTPDHTPDQTARFANEAAASVRLLDAELSQLNDLPAAFAAPVACREAIALLLSELAGEEIRGPRRADGVTVGGWLDAGMADEPHIVLAGFAEGQVPEGTVTDPLLPDGIRAAVGMMSGMRRAARDAWILDGILLRAKARATQPGGASVSFVVPRQTEAGDPLKPSRFLLRVEDDALPERVALLFPTEVDSERPRIEAAGGSVARFERTPPIKPATDAKQRIESVSVTAFKSYLQCPYLFQLRYDPRLRLGDVDERAMELDARSFGNLVHAALERWGDEERAGGRRTEDAETIERDAGAYLDAIVKRLYPKSCAAAVRVQVELARRRIRRFAQLQAEQAREGWKVCHVELSFQRQPVAGTRQAPRLPDANGLFLTGRIDRVDQHDALGYRALDYKTGAKADSPTATHVKKSRADAANPAGSRWVDLQLPLYRVLLRSMSPSIGVGVAGLGYINLAPTAEKSGFVMLDAKKVTDAMLDEAEALAADIVRKIQAGEFTPDERVPIGADDALAPIWGLGQRGLVDAGAIGSKGGDE